MKRPVLVNAILLVCAIFGLVSCGGTTRQLQSISISPQSSTAQNGQSQQFTATGQFNTTPMTVTPLPVSWNLRGPGIDILVLAIS
ncbi:MAG TPA: hypothetical protein VJW55_03210 [Candidatus Angelobacter sp.]|nr:hypothetical protein [Candidatus Angelobacter sp.]